MPIGAAISAVGSLGAAGIGAWGANSAANAQVNAQQQVLQAIQSTIGPILQQGQGITNSVLPTLTALLTGSGQGAAGIQNTLNNLPGFQFAQNWGQKAVQNLGTTTGLGGNVLTAGANYATGLAQQNYSNYVSGLQGLLNSGLQTETNAASTLASGQQSALSSIGNANASAALGTANAISGGLSGLGNAGLLYGLGSRLGIGGGGGASIYSSPAWSGANVTGLT
jgi:hypothetical protein